MDKLAGRVIADVRKVFSGRGGAEAAGAGGLEAGASVLGEARKDIGPDVGKGDAKVKDAIAGTTALKVQGLARSFRRRLTQPGGENCKKSGNATAN